MASPDSLRRATKRDAEMEAQAVLQRTIAERDEIEASLKKEARLEAEAAATQLAIAKRMAEDEKSARQAVLAKWEETEEAPMFDK